MECPATEIFQREMSSLLHGMPGVSVYQDDILVYGNDMAEHDRHLEDVLNRIQKSGLKLNKQKCILRQPEIDFLGHCISEKGVRAHPDKVNAIMDMPDPGDIHELRRFMGMVNYLGRFVKNLAKYTKDLNVLLQKDRIWTWGPSQKAAFNNLKKIVSSSPVLAFYDVNKSTVVCADASGYGLGGVILQAHGNQLRPVAFCSRTLTQAEQGYAPIEKECLSCTWTCEKFSRYLVGLENIRLMTDHKPLVPLINSRDIDQTPIRCQRLLMRLMRYNVTAAHVPGKDQVVADTLSRKPQVCNEIPDTVAEVKAYVDGVMSSSPILDPMLRRIEEATRDDAVLQKAIHYTKTGWPRTIQHENEDIKDLYHVRGELSIANGFLVRGSRIVVPKQMQVEILEKLHHGHLGMTKSRERANQTVWWSGLSSEIDNYIRQCTHCQMKRPSQRSEPMVSTPLPDRPWQKIGTDLLDYKGKTFIVMVDYYSRYIEIAYLGTATSQSVICKMKDVFARWGIPESIMSDNGPQYSSRQFAEFAKEYAFVHTTSSPHYPQSNGEAERFVQVAKKIIAQDDPFLALMTYRSTPLASTGYSPVELMVGM